jgi:hypothetical protein
MIFVFLRNFGEFNVVLCVFGRNLKLLTSFFKGNFIVFDIFRRNLKLLASLEKTAVLDIFN